MTSAAPITVDIWSDIACPWCFIGKRRFEAGLQEYRAADPGAPAVEVTYHSFELSPDTPVDFDGSAADFLARHKGLPAAQVQQMLTRVTDLATAEGLHYDYDALQHTNTVLAHQLLHLAKAHGKQAEMKERLLAAYFEQGRHVGRVDDLADLAAEVGLDRDEVVAALSENRYLADVRADQRQAVEYGINGVPFFVIDGRYGISGAQEAGTFAQALTQVAGEHATNATV